MERNDAMQYKHPEFLVSTNWLAANLDDPNLRIFDCAAQPRPNPDKSRRKKFPLSPQPVRALYEEKHIPGAGYIDVPNDLTDRSSEMPMMLAPVDQLVDTFTRAGISNNSRVVLYSLTGAMWATRVWCTLRSLGFDNTAILDGGIGKWIAEQRPVSTAPSSYPAGILNANPRAGIFVDKARVRDALDDDETLIVHALTPSVFDGSNDQLVFGRRGHIPGSVNIPSASVHHPDTGTYLSADELLKIFEGTGVHKARQIVTYCGGGINASVDTFALALMGYDNVSIYDGSMNEWGNDATLPVERS
jgi:thiosulfate/3-mercaptopyruvate sulfurtransferase